MKVLGSIHESTDTFTSGGKELRVERFDPEEATGRPAVLLLHGSDGLRYRGEAYRELARALARKGRLALLLHYLEDGGGVRRLSSSPLVFLTWMQSVADAITFATRQPAAHPERVGLVGFSLGAYLALSVAAQDQRVAAVVECFGGLPDLLASGLQRLPPVLILHGDADWMVPVAEARKLERLLRERGLPYEIKIYPGQGHGFTGEASVDALRRALDFLDRHLED